MSQKRRDLDIIAHHAGLDDRLLRPLSARLLPPTAAERTGLVDRERLYAFSGRSRKELISLARNFDFPDIPSPSNGCALTEQLFAKKVHDLVLLDSNNTRWDFELLKNGRHFRYDERTKVVVGKNESDNQMLRYRHQLPEGRSSLLLTPENFAGPVVLLIGPAVDHAVRFAGGLLLRYTRKYNPDDARLRIHRHGAGNSAVRRFTRLPAAQQAHPLAAASR